VDKSVDEGELPTSEEDRSTEDLVAFLGEAMESEKDIELEPEMIAELPRSREEPLKRELALQPYDVPPAEPAKPYAGVPLQPIQAPTQPQQADSMMILLIITGVVVIVSTIIIAIVSWLQ
jgi:hypothetical protein